MCGFIAQLVEHRTGIAEVTGSNPVEALAGQVSSFLFETAGQAMSYLAEHAWLLISAAVVCDSYHTNDCFLVFCLRPKYGVGCVGAPACFAEEVVSEFWIGLQAGLFGGLSF